jgi:hypothetical protein
VPKATSFPAASVTSTWPKPPPAPTVMTRLSARKVEAPVGIGAQKLTEISVLVAHSSSGRECTTGYPSASSSSTPSEPKQGRPSGPVTQLPVSMAPQNICPREMTGATRKMISGPPTMKGTSVRGAAPMIRSCSEGRSPLIAVSGNSDT